MPGVCHSSLKATNVISYLRFELSFSFVILYKCFSIYSLRILYMHTVYIDHVYLLLSSTTLPRSPPHFPLPALFLFLKTHWIQLVLPIWRTAASPSSHWFPQGRMTWSRESVRVKGWGGLQQNRQDMAGFCTTRGACGCLPLRPALDQANQNSSMGQGEAHEAHP